MGLGDQGDADRRAGLYRLGVGRQREPTRTAADGSSHHNADKVRYEGLSKTLDKWHLAVNSVNDLRVWGIADNDQAEFDKLAALITSLTTPLLGLKLRTVQLAQRMSSMVCVMRCTWARTDTRDENILPDYLIHSDGDNVTNRAIVSELNGLPTNPNLTFTVLSGLDVRKLNDGVLKFTATYEGWNPKQEKELGGTYRKTSTTGISDSGQNVVVFTTASGVPTGITAPTGLKKVAQTPQNFSAFQSVLTTTFDVTDDAEKIIFPETPTVTDVSNLRSTQAIGQVYLVASGEPSIPSAPSGLVYRDKRILRVVSPDTGAAQNVVFWQYGETTNADETTFGAAPKTLSISNDIESENLIASIITTGASAPSPSRYTRHPEDR